MPRAVGDGPEVVQTPRLGPSVCTMLIGLAAVIVDDYDEAIDFFTRCLRFELVEDRASTTDDGQPKRWVVVQPPGAQTGLLLAQADGPEQTAAVGAQYAGRVGLFLHVDDFDEMHAHMTAQGVEFLETPRNEVYGKVAVFRDLTGTKWDLLGPATTTGG